MLQSWHTVKQGVGTSQNVRAKRCLFALHLFAGVYDVGTFCAFLPLYISLFVVLFIPFSKKNAYNHGTIFSHFFSGTR